MAATFMHHICINERSIGLHKEKHNMWINKVFFLINDSVTANDAIQMNGNRM